MLNYETGTLDGETLYVDEEYTIDNGVTTFLSDIDHVMCVLTNAKFPNFYLYTNFIDATSGIEDVAVDGKPANADVYTLQGVLLIKDATDEQRQIQEINTGILIANGADMKRWLAKLTNNNAQGEYYITDIIALAYQEGREIVAVHPQRLSEVEGVNNRLQLSRLERVYQSEQAEKLLLAGVMLRDPARF